MSIGLAKKTHSFGCGKGARKPSGLRRCARNSMEYSKALFQSSRIIRPCTTRRFLRFRILTADWHRFRSVSWKERATSGESIPIANRVPQSTADRCKTLMCTFNDRCLLCPNLATILAWREGASNPHARPLWTVWQAFFFFVQIRARIEWH